MFYLLSNSGPIGSGEGLPSPLRWEFSRPTLDHHLSGGGSGQLSPRSPSVTELLRPRRIRQCTSNSPFSYPLSLRKLKKSPKITFSSISPYSHKILFSPSSLHFCRYFSLLPILYLPPLLRGLKRK